MGLEQLGHITKMLMNSGLNKKTKIAIIENATSIKQRVITGNLDNIEKKAKQKKVQTPSIIIVGKVVGIQKKIEWFNLNHQTSKSINLLK